MTDDGSGQRPMQPRDELAELPADRRIAGLAALEAQLPAVARPGQIRVALGERERDTGRRPPGERPERCGNPVEPDLREVRDEDRRPRRPRADPAEPLQDGPLADDDRLVGLVDADRPLRGLRHAGDERREPVAGPGASPRTAVLLSGDRHDRERPARLGRQRHAQPVGQADGPDDVERRDVGRSVAVDRRRGGPGRRPRAAQLVEQPGIGPVRLDLDPRHSHEDHDGAAADRPVHARVGLRPDEQLHRDRRRPAQARPPRRVRRRGVVGGPARAARLRRGPRRPRPAARRPTPPSRTPASSGRTSSATPRRSSASRRSSSSRRSCSRRGRR